MLATLAVIKFLRKDAAYWNSKRLNHLYKKGCTLNLRKQGLNCGRLPCWSHEPIPSCLSSRTGRHGWPNSFFMFFLNMLQRQRLVSQWSPSTQVRLKVHALQHKPFPSQLPKGTLNWHRPTWMHLNWIIVWQELPGCSVDCQSLPHATVFCFTHPYLQSWSRQCTSTGLGESEQLSCDTHRNI